ncbi:Tripartite motif-containing protein 2 [Stylophora pistillata]|uniref:Tripartite motif-containing protein 2 n=1 Tax=Stylophora pistillata TaxID=50429 RepID=A0A2B4R319_STYPI|nr:Tripartite motif-containing protein 2 [Stylophora pistillata]
MIAVIEAKKQEIFNEADHEAQQSLERLRIQRIEMEQKVKMIETAVTKFETLLKRSTSAELAELDKAINTIIPKEVDDEREQLDCDLEGLRQLIFEENEALKAKTIHGGIGRVFSSESKADQSTAKGKGLTEAIIGIQANFVLTTKNAKGQQCYEKRDRVTAEIKNQEGHDCATEVRVKDNHDGSYKVSYFAKETGRCQAVVKIFSSDGTYLRSFGSKGDKQGEFNYPTGIAFDKNNNIIVVDSGNHRVQLFSEQGEYLSQFGGKGNLDHQLFNPHGLSVENDGNIIIADSKNKLIKTFSPKGHYLNRFEGEGSLTYPVHCIQYEKYLIVSDSDEHCIKVFDRNSSFLYKFGKEGNGDGEFNYPQYLSVNKAGHLMVCDSLNHRVQVFDLSGKFITKFGSRGDKKGEFNAPFSAAVLSDGRILVSEFSNHGIQIFE